MAPARTRWFLGAAAGVIALLFAGRWAAGVAVERWWAAGVAPEAVGFLARWQLLRSGLEIGGILVAGAWCVGHLLLVVRSIGTVQVPRRIGDLEIREALPPETLRAAAIVLGILLGVLVGRGGAEAAAEVMLAWRGVRFDIADPLLHLDAGVYIAQMPFWDRLLDAATLLVWMALALALVAHLAVGGIRFARAGVAMTDPARTQVGWLLAGALLLGAAQEALAPVADIGRAAPWGTPTLPPAVHSVVAIAWVLAALVLARWTIRPAPATALLAVVLWAGSGIASRVIIPGNDTALAFDPAVLRRVAAVNVGLDSVMERSGPPESGVERPRGSPLWYQEELRLGLQGSGGRMLALAPAMIGHGAAEVPVWLGVRRDSTGELLLAIADDRLAPGGGPISYRRGDPADYPGIVSWDRLSPLALLPGARDTVAPRGPGILLGGRFQRLVVSWGAQTTRPLEPEGGPQRFQWRRDPKARVSHLLPAFRWDDATPAIDSGALVWLLDGWTRSSWGPFAAPIGEWPERPRYARPAVIALVDAGTGRTRFFLRADADPVAQAWGRIVGPLLEPWERAPAVVGAAAIPRSWVAVQAAALSHPPFVPTGSGPREGGEALPVLAWTGGRVEWQSAITAGGRLDRLVHGTQEEGVARTTVTQWADSSHAPLSPLRYIARWERFASFERLGDSVAAAGGRVVLSPVRFEVGVEGTAAVQMVYLARPGGSLSVGWVNLAGAGKLGAARGPGAAWANLLGESAPLVPEPESPDRMVEARRWAARADSALRAGDLEAFGRAFEALKQLLGTP